MSEISFIDIANPKAPETNSNQERNNVNEKTHAQGTVTRSVSMKANAQTNPQEDQSEYYNIEKINPVVTLPRPQKKEVDPYNFSLQDEKRKLMIDKFEFFQSTFNYNKKSREYCLVALHKKEQELQSVKSKKQYLEQTLRDNLRNLIECKRFIASTQSDLLDKMEETKLNLEIIVLDDALCSEEHKTLLDIVSVPLFQQSYQKLQRIQSRFEKQVTQIEEEYKKLEKAVNEIDLDPPTKWLEDLKLQLQEIEAIFKQHLEEQEKIQRNEEPYKDFLEELNDYHKRSVTIASSMEKISFNSDRMTTLLDDFQKLTSSISTDYNNNLAEWQECNRAVRSIHYLPRIYVYCVEEIKRRLRWGQDYRKLLEDLQKQLRSKTEHEVSKRMRFHQQTSKYMRSIPKNLFPGLTQPVPYAGIYINDFDSQLPKINLEKDYIIQDPRTLKSQRFIEEILQIRNEKNLAFPVTPLVEEFPSAPLPSPSTVPVPKLLIPPEPETKTNEDTGPTIFSSPTPLQTFSLSSDSEAHNTKIPVDTISVNSPTEGITVSDSTLSNTNPEVQKELEKSKTQMNFILNQLKTNVTQKLSMQKEIENYSQATEQMLSLISQLEGSLRSERRKARAIQVDFERSINQTNETKRSENEKVSVLVQMLNTALEYEDGSYWSGWQELESLVAKVATKIPNLQDRIQDQRKEIDQLHDYIQNQRQLIEILQTAQATTPPKDQRKLTFSNFAPGDIVMAKLDRYKYLVIKTTQQSSLYYYVSSSNGPYVYNPRSSDFKMLGLDKDTVIGRIVYIDKQKWQANGSITQGTPYYAVFIEPVPFDNELWETLYNN